MKPLLCVSVLFLLVAAITSTANASETPPEQEPPVTYVIIKNDGSRFVGHIIEQDAREVLIETRELGQVYIPRHEIREIREVASGEIQRGGEFIPAEIFSTRYFITTNGLPVAKGESYILWSLLGPDFQFGISDNLGIGILTTWVGTPLIGSIKYSFSISEKWNGGLGTLLATGSWAMPDFAGILPYGVITYGDRVRNINLSLGYGGLTFKNEYYEYRGDDYSYREERESEGAFLISVAAMAKINNSISFVFDTFIVPRSGTYQTTEYDGYYDSNFNWVETYKTVTRKKYSVALILPGLRFQTKSHSAFQFGFAGIRAEGETIGVPFPMVQWFRKL